jgi:NAD(P)-dependent dehydrogenase (short-subunit alcohol dehydrogenase family)
MPVVFITGANRGLGLEFARQYARDGWNVIGTTRRLDAADELRSIGKNVEVVELDVDDFAAVKALPGKLGNRALDVVILNAGLSGQREATAENFDPDAWHRLFHTNVMGPTALAGALYPLVRQGKPGKMLAMSSAMGSMALNSDRGMKDYDISIKGGQYLYRSSKAALNMVWCSFAVDHPDVIACVLSPGWVRTDMGGPKAHLSPEQSVTGLRAAIGKLTLADTASMFHYDGRKLPW